MEIKNNLLGVKETIKSIFNKSRKTVQENLALTVLSLLKSDNCQLTKIAQEMSIINSNSYDTNYRRIERFMQADTFQVDDKIWRCHLNLVFGLLEERSMIEKGCFIQINIDYTSKTDEFLILSASLPFEGRGIPLYFSMRNYPIKKGQFDQNKMEEAFMNELNLLLPKGYKYILVADRGFGNTRFLKLCEEKGFKYILRTQDNWKIEVGIEQTTIKDIIKKQEKENKEEDNQIKRKDKDYGFIKLKTSGVYTRLITKFKDQLEKGWYLFTNLDESEFDGFLIYKGYSNRFKIEKMFQDEKSSGFDIEESKLKKYSRFKRLLFCVYVAQAIMMFIGDFINGNADHIKKKFHFHINLISAFSN